MFELRVTEDPAQPADDARLASRHPDLLGAAKAFACAPERFKVILYLDPAGRRRWLTDDEDRFLELVCERLARRAAA